MKKLILLFTICFPFLLQAQYFHKLYGTSDADGLSSGVATSNINIGQGHFMVGIKHGNTTAPQSRVLATHTRVDGTTVFNKFFSLRTAQGVSLSVNDVQGFELLNLAGFGIVGTYSRTNVGGLRPLYGVFYIRLDPLGNVITIKKYQTISGATIPAKIGGINKSVQSYGRELYVTGTAYDNNLTYAFAMSISTNNGNLHWGKVYDLQAPTPQTVESGDDIIENPYKSNTITRELMMIGNTHETPFTQGMPHDTYAARIDAFTGNPVIASSGNNTIVHSGSGDGRYFNGISLASTFSGGRQGFMIAGSWFDQFTGHDFCLTKLDSVGLLVYQKIYPYNNNIPNSYTQDILNNVIERENTFGNIEYYAVGYTAQGNIGNADIVVLKTDDNGNGLLNGQFTFGSTDNEYGLDIDMDNSIQNGGLSIFGSRNTTGAIGIGGSDMYHVRAYFNGESGCNERIETPITYSGGLGDGGHNAFVIDEFNTGKLNVKQLNATDYTICSNTSLLNGNNARKIQQGEEAATISPNPLTAGSNFANVELDVEQPTEVTVGIYDLLGRNYYTHNYTLVNGVNNLSLNISDVNMATGMYSVRITGKNYNKNIMLIVK